MPSKVCTISSGVGEEVGVGDGVTVGDGVAVDEGSGVAVLVGDAVGRLVGVMVGGLYGVGVGRIARDRDPPWFADKAISALVGDNLGSGVATFIADRPI